MAREKAEDDKPLDRKVADWLSRQGYRLEYETCNAFNAVHLQASMGRYLALPGEKPRDIDVWVERTSTCNGPQSAIVLRMICECKYDSKPWVLLRTWNRPHFDPTWVPRSENLISRLDFGEAFHNTKESEFIAHRVLQAKLGSAGKPDGKDDDWDVAYNALQKVCYAAWGIAGSAEWLPHDAPNAFAIAIPCLVVESKLFSAYFDSEKQAFEVAEIESGRLCWLGCRPEGTMVDVVSAGAIRDYASRMAMAFNRIRRILGGD
jgi:hypothetical protein